MKWALLLRVTDRIIAVSSAVRVFLGTLRKDTKKGDGGPRQA